MELKFSSLRAGQLIGVEVEILVWNNLFNLVKEVDRGNPRYMTHADEAARLPYNKSKNELSEMDLQDPRENPLFILHSL